MPCQIHFKKNVGWVGANINKPNLKTVGREDHHDPMKASLG